MHSGRFNRYSFVTLLVAALVVIAASPALSAPKMVRIEGRGWGHGIGMSQYGAFGYAQHGWGGERILRHYYTGAKVVNKSVGRKVRVGMLQGRSSITIRPQVKTRGGGLVVLSDTTQNSGGAAAPASTSRAYLSTNTTLDVADTALGSRTLAGLAAGEGHAGTTGITIPPGTAPGRWYVIVKADADGVVAESYETNNTRYVAITVN